MIRGQKLMVCKSDLVAAQVALENSPQDPLLQTIFLEYQQNLRDVETQRFSGGDAV